MTRVEGTDAVAPRVDLYWIPLGAGDTTGCVRRNGRLFEAALALRERRTALDLYHSALQVHLHGSPHVIEMTPVWGCDVPERGVVCQGPVGLAVLGRFRAFRYEVRCWRDGTLPDEHEAVGGPQSQPTDPARARRLLELVASFPTLTWGRDELGTGDMWNSNSLIAWLLARSGHAVTDVRPPPRGRAPGWFAGLTLASRQGSASTTPGTDGGLPRDGGPFCTPAPGDRLGTPAQGAPREESS